MIDAARPRARVWRTGVDPARIEDYETFALDRSLPMFRSHDGFLGVIFGSDEASRTVITLWRDEAAIAALEASPRYQSTVRAIEAAGFLLPPQSVAYLRVDELWLDGSVDAASVRPRQ